MTSGFRGASAKKKKSPDQRCKPTSPRRRFTALIWTFSFGAYCMPGTSLFKASIPSGDKYPHAGTMRTYSTVLLSHVKARAEFWSWLLASLRPRTGDSVGLDIFPSLRTLSWWDKESP